MIAATLLTAPVPALADPTPEPTATPSVSESPSTPTTSPSTPTTSPSAPGTPPAEDTPAPGADAVATTVTVTPPSHSLPAGETRTFSGVVSNGGVPLAGVRVSVIQQAGTGWKFVAHVTTGADGAWSYTFAPITNTTWRTDFYGNELYPAGFSPLYSATIVQFPGVDRINSATAFVHGRSGWASWAVYDQLTKRWYGDSRQAQVNNTESMIKVWIAADLIMGVQQTGRTTLTAYERSLISKMIRYSDDQATENVYRLRGRNEVINRLIRICGLTDTYIGKTNRWSWTKMSPRDGVRMGLCIMPAKHLWTPYANYLLGEMRSVAPSNAFGIQQAYPAGDGVRIAVKNGWTAQGALSIWNVNCLGIWGAGNRWLLVVETRYPVNLEQGYGAITCQETTRRLFR